MTTLHSPKDSERSPLRSVLRLATQRDLQEMECRLTHIIRDAVEALKLDIQHVMLTAKELEDGLNALTEQEGKIAKEQADRSDKLQATIVELQKQIEAGGVTPGIETAFTNLKAAAQSLDDVIPDPPAP